MRNDLAAVGNDDVVSAEGMRPVFVGEPSGEGDQKEAVNLAQQPVGCLGRRELANGRHGHRMPGFAGHL